MNDATAALLAVFVVLSLPATAVAAGTPDGGTDRGFEATLQQDSPSGTTPTDVDNTTNRLQLDGDVRSEYAEYSPDLGLALASADDELRIDHEQYAAVDAEFDEATDGERAELIQNAYDRLTNRAAELEQREREAVRAHAAGERSTAELLRTLLRNHNEAILLSERLGDLEERTDRVPGYSLSSEQLRADRTTFEFHNSPVRASLERVAESSADGDHLDVVVSTSQDGYALSIMEDSRYIVETTRFSNRDESAPDQFQEFEALEHTTRLYPWADEHGSLHFQDNSPTNLYWIDLFHDQGRLEIYLDGGTGNVHREVQELDAPLLPVTGTAVQSGDGLEMTINETPANGPIEVAVTDPETGAPESATVTVDGVEVGETGDDGKLWVVPPLGEYELAATTTTGSVNATLSSG
jgi:hypothetical protein